MVFKIVELSRYNSGIESKNCRIKHTNIYMNMAPKRLCLNMCWGVTNKHFPFELGLGGAVRTCVYSYMLLEMRELLEALVTVRTVVLAYPRMHQVVLVQLWFAAESFQTRGT